MTATSYKTKQIYLIFLIGLLLTACGRNKKIDVSNIAVDVQIERFDKDFDALRTKPMEQQAIYLQQKYGSFYRDYVEQILGAGSINDTAYFKMLDTIFKRREYNDLKHDVDAAYPNMDKQNAELTDAFKHIKYYYPEKKLPRVYAYNSGFNAQTAIGDSYFGVALDMFLGADSRFYSARAVAASWPHYLSRRFTPGNIVPRIVEGIAREDMFPKNDNDKSLLSRMIYNGKILYFMDQVLPNVPDSTKIGYTTQQLKWCEDAKAYIWGYFLDRNLLYETDYPKIQTYLNEAPFTPGVAEKNEASPKLAVWTGWQIVRQYMEKHPEVTLPQLMAIGDAQKILNESKYRPK